MKTKEAWLPVCLAGQVPEGAGVAVLLASGEQAAIFRTVSGELYALSNLDPFSNAFVLSRGIVGDSAGKPFVASPVYKQRFDLRTGECLDDDGVRVASYPVRVLRGVVQLGQP